MRESVTCDEDNLGGMHNYEDHSAPEEDFLDRHRSKKHIVKRDTCCRGPPLSHSEVQVIYGEQTRKSPTSNVETSSSCRSRVNY